MSQPFSRCLHPFDAAHHPAPEPEVQEAILTALANGRNEPGASRRTRKRTTRRPDGHGGGETLQ